MQNNIEPTYSDSVLNVFAEHSITIPNLNTSHDSINTGNIDQKSDDRGNLSAFESAKQKLKNFKEKFDHEAHHKPNDSSATPPVEASYQVVQELFDNKDKSLGSLFGQDILFPFELTTSDYMRRLFACLVSGIRNPVIKVSVSCKLFL